MFSSWPSSAFVDGVRMIPDREEGVGIVHGDGQIMFGAGCFGSTQPARILIATGELEEGPYTLAVTVMDRRTRERVEKKSRFSIMK